MRVILTRVECEHLALCFNERALRDVPGITILPPEFRMRFVRAVIGTGDTSLPLPRERQQEPLMFEFSDDELRALDMLLTDADPRAGKLPDGTSVLGLVEKVWRALSGGGILRLNGDENAEDRDADPHAHDRAPADGPGDYALT